jgi:hypothetical protein
MTTYKYKGAIYLKSGKHHVSVECDAQNPSQASQIIQSIYDVRSWKKQMAKV